MYTLLLSTFLGFFPQIVYSYVPASPTNSTNVAIAGGLNVTDVSQLNLQWYSNGSYSENVSYQLVGQESSGNSKGALVHFSEIKANSTTPPTSTPWIALVSCDYNATDASQEDDIFTIARDKGAVAALLYSLYSAACVINPEYADPENFDQVFDIFSTKSLTAAHLIEYQFGQIGTNASAYSWYDSQRLNDTGLSVNESIEAGYPLKTMGYLLATLRAYNATGDPDTVGTGGGTGGSSSSSSGSSNTGLAMIILYAITGCVSALFCVVIITGAVRAIRHPERYGRRRTQGGFGPAQSRAGGLGRAILDTFPIVKFGTSTQDEENVNTEEHKDPEALGTTSGYPRPTKSMEMVNVGLEGRRGGEAGNVTETQSEASSLVSELSQRQDSSTGDREQARASGSGHSNVVPLATPRPPKIHNNDSTSGVSPNGMPGDGAHVVPAAIGRETCPICIVDFEEGDDLRLLPCEGKHRFHQQCVDPWLLELSSSCPICRHDFLALETMLSRNSEDEEEEDDGYLHPASNHEHPARTNRFSRYIRSAIRRRHRQDDENDPTDPYMPRAAETSP